MQGFKKRLWLINRSKKLLIRRTEKKRKCKNLRRHNGGKDVITHDANFFSLKIAEQKSRVNFIAPKSFSIESNGEETLEFFSNLISFVENKYENTEEKTLYIDSSQVVDVTESTLMYLFAIVSDAKAANFDIGGNHPKKEKIRRLYKQCGFDRIMSKKSFTQQYFDDNEVFIVRGEKIPTKTVANICKFIRKETGIETRSLYEALIELMGNTTQHAYYEDDKLEKKWQIFIKNSLSKVRLIFLDTGRGIPSTVRKNWNEKLRSIFPPVLDVKESKILQSAFEGNFRTRTESPKIGRAHV